MTVIKQNKFIIKTGFEFGESDLFYTYKGSGSSTEFKIPYINIPRKPTRIIKDKYTIFRNMGVAGLVIGVAIAIQQYLKFGSVHDTLFLHIGVICMILYFLSEITTSVLDTSDGGIVVLKDKNHDKILEEINNHRFQELKKRLLILCKDKNVDPEEIKRWLNHLLENEEITEVELDKLRSVLVEQFSEHNFSKEVSTTIQ